MAKNLRRKPRSKTKPRPTKTAEAAKLLEFGFEYVTEVEGGKMFRKQK